MTATARAETIEALRRSRSLAIDTGKSLEHVRNHCFLIGNHAVAAETVEAKRVLWDLVKLLNGLLADESERAEGKS